MPDGNFVPVLRRSEPKIVYFTLVLFAFFKWFCFLLYRIPFNIDSTERTSRANIFASTNLHFPLPIHPNVVFSLQDYLLPEQFRNYFHKLKNPLQVWKVKKYTKKRIRLLRRGLSAVNIFSSNVHRAIFVSANAHRMY